MFKYNSVFFECMKKRDRVFQVFSSLAPSLTFSLENDFNAKIMGKV